MGLSRAHMNLRLWRVQVQTCVWGSCIQSMWKVQVCCLNCTLGLHHDPPLVPVSPRSCPSPAWRRSSKTPQDVVPSVFGRGCHGSGAEGEESLSSSVDANRVVGGLGLRPSPAFVRRRASAMYNFSQPASRVIVWRQCRVWSHYTPRQCEARSHYTHCECRLSTDTAKGTEIEWGHL